MYEVGGQSATSFRNFRVGLKPNSMHCRVDTRPNTPRNPQCGTRGGAGTYATRRTRRTRRTQFHPCLGAASEDNTDGIGSTSSLDESFVEMATEMATSTVPVTATTSSSSSGDLSAGTEDATIGHIVSLALPALVVVLSDPLQTLVGIEVLRVLGVLRVLRVLNTDRGRALALTLSFRSFVRSAG